MNALAATISLNNEDKTSIVPPYMRDLALDYLKYLALDFQYPRFGKCTFCEMVDVVYKGNIEAGFREFLYPIIFRRIQQGTTFNAALIWIAKEKGIRMATMQEQSLMLFAIKQIILTNTHEDLIQLVGLGQFDLK
jgi:hypothetical protein